ncbi:MAG: peptidylprolyl isomerase [Bdellovibrionales bacterium]|nr:peptidylprolyl isomerase [Bdellovibrionales bacterium]
MTHIQYAKAFFVILLFLSGCSTSMKDYRPAEIATTAAELIRDSADSDWRNLDPQKTIYLDLKKGRVIIELADFVAPQHVKNIKTIIKNRYWDDLFIMRSQDNYVVQWGYPGKKDEFQIYAKKLKGVKKALKAEIEVNIGRAEPFTSLPDPDTYATEVGFAEGFAMARSSNEGKAWMVHCYGAVGVSRDESIDSGGGTSLYVVTGHSPRHLDRNITLVGRVVSGMEHLSTLPRGKGPLGFYINKKNYIPIQKVRLASELPIKKRSKIQVMRTDTELFKRYLEARRYRTEKWFHRPTGRLEICNVPRVTR